MASYKAWVLTCLHHGAGPNGSVPAIPIGVPLALLPPRAAPERVEGAMAALHQVLCEFTAADMVGTLRRQPPDRVEWDELRMSARIGHDLEVWAHRSTVAYDTRPGIPSAGVIRYTYPKWATTEEVRVLARQLGEAGEPAPFDEARRRLSEQTSTWPS